MNCLICGQPTVTQNDYFVQKTEKRISSCRPCFTKEIFNTLERLDSPYLVFQPAGTYYHIQISSFGDDIPQKLDSVFEQLTGACSFCTQEASKTLWYTCNRSQLQNQTGERLGKRCIYANLSELFKKSSGMFIAPETVAEKNQKKIKKKWVEFLPLSEASFKFL